MSAQHNDFLTIRVFISSTFRDFHAERDYLVKNVFPELRQWCLQYRLNLVDIDLRWGITKEQAESGQVIELCLQEIDGARPFFICLLGGRYGWIPGEDNFPEDIAPFPRAKEKKNISITHMEIEHAVIQPYHSKPGLQQQMNSYFYFRDDNCYPPSDVLSDFNPDELKEYLNTFLEQTPEGISKLQNLKNQVRELFQSKGILTDHVRNYTPVFNPLLKNPEESRLKGRFDPDSLHALGEWVISDLKKAVINDYRERIAYYESRHTTDYIDFDQSDFLIEAKSVVFAGRTEYVNRIAQFARTPASGILLVTGESGSGKSSILSKTIQLLKADKAFNPVVLNYFSGMGSSSETTANLLLRLVKQLASGYEHPVELPSSHFELVRIFYHLAGLIQKPVVVFIDGINQMENPTEAISWIEDNPESHLRFIISCTPDEIPALLLKKKIEKIVTSPFSEYEKTELLDLFPGIYSKTLSASQKQAILQKKGTGNPLYLKTLLEELRLFGSFEQIESRIFELPDNLTGLFNALLVRLEEEYGQELVLWFFLCIELSEFGFSETEFSEMLGFENNRNTLPLLIRQTRPLLLYNGPYIRIAHQAISHTIRSRYLEGYTNEVAGNCKLEKGKVMESDAHHSIMRYFLKKGSENNQWIESASREARGFHYHAIKAGRQDAIKPFLSNPSFLIASCKCKFDKDSKVYRGFFDFMHLLYVSFDMPVAKAIIDFFRARSYLLSHFPDMIPNELYNNSFAQEDPYLENILKPDVKELKPGLVAYEKHIPHAETSGHCSRITALGIAPVGVHVLTGALDGSVALWEREKKRPIVSGYFHKSGITSISFSPNGLYGLSASLDGTLLLWECSTGENSIIISHDTKWDSIPFAAFMDDDTLFYVRRNCLIAVDIHSRTVKWKDEELLSGFPETGSCHYSFDPDTSVLAVLHPGDDATEIIVYSLRERQILDTAGIDSDVQKIVIKGKYILSIDRTNRIVVFDFSEGQLDMLETGFNISTATPMLNHDFLLTDNYANVYVFKPEDCQLSDPLPANDFQGWHTTDSVAFCRQSFRLLIPAIDGTFYEFCFRERILKFRYPSSFSINHAIETKNGIVASTGVYKISERNDGERICLIAPDGNIDYSSNNSHNNNIRALAVIDGKKFASFHSNGEIVNWENLSPLSSNTFQHSFTTSYKPNSSSTILLGTDAGQLLAYQSGNSINKINFSFPQQSFANFVNAISFTEQPVTFVAGSGNGVISLLDKTHSWNVQPDALRITALALSAADQTVAAGNLNGTIRIIREGKVIYEKIIRPTGITSLLFTSDNKHLWIAYADGNIFCLSAISFEPVTGCVVPGIPILVSEVMNNKISVVTNCGMHIFYYF